MDGVPQVIRVRIADMRPATAEEWDRAWASSGCATYFHSREWAEIWAAYSGDRMRPAPRLVSFTDGNQAVLPLTVRRSASGLVSTVFSSPAGTFGGWISPGVLSRDHCVLLTSLMSRKLGPIIWRLNPYDECAISVKPGSAKADHTRALDVTVDFADVFRLWSKGHRAAVRQAQRSDASVRIASKASDWQEYFEAYTDSLRRWGTKASSRYAWDLFKIIQERESEWVHLYVCEHKGEVVAGALCLLSPTHVAYWHGATKEAHMPARPANLLLYHAIQDACAGPQTWFDFNPSGGHLGVESFKKSFGTSVKGAPVFTRTSLVTKLHRFATRLRPFRARASGHGKEPATGSSDGTKTD